MTGLLNLDIYIRNIFYIVPIYLVIYNMLGLYKPYRTGLRKDAFNLVKANILGLFVFATALYALKESNISRWLFLIFRF